MSRKNYTTTNFLHTVGNYFGHNPLPDNQEVGIEIEVEGTNLPKGRSAGWTNHEDGSLRGESNEYVFSPPASRAQVLDRLQRLENRLRAADVTVNESYRTSVHVHLNARDLTFKQVYSWILLYTVFEDVMASFAGDDRVGNLFCLRVKDAEYFIDQVTEAVRTDNPRMLINDVLRYSACNPVALGRHGTLEFRSLRGTTDANLIYAWYQLLLAIKDYAVSLDNPSQIVEQISLDGPVGFAQRVFTPEQLGMLGDITSVYDNVRLIQAAAYGYDWNMEPVENNQVDRYLEETRRRPATIIMDDPGFDRALAAVNTMPIYRGNGFVNGAGTGLRPWGPPPRPFDDVQQEDM